MKIAPVFLLILSLVLTGTAHAETMPPPAPPILYAQPPVTEPELVSPTEYPVMEILEEPLVPMDAPAGDPLDYWKESADTLDHVTLSVSGGYDVLKSGPQIEGTGAFHLVHPDGTSTETITLAPSFLIGADSMVFFESRLGAATSDQIAEVWISTNDGQSWSTIWSQPGLGWPGQTRYHRQNISLTLWNGQTVRLRFQYRFSSGSYFSGDDIKRGWLIDDIQIGETYVIEASPYSIGEPTGLEQQNLEFINRARASASAEALRLRDTDDPDVVAAMNFFNVDKVLLVEQFGELTETVPPLVFNAKLTAAARLHSQDMLDNEFQGHTSSDNPPPPNEPYDRVADRLSRQGYDYSTAAENVYAYAKSCRHAHAGFNIDWGSGSEGSIGGMQNPPGHRISIHNERFREIGIGILEGSNGPVGPMLVTQNFGTSHSMNQPFITGVAWQDLDGNGEYDPGEGLGGIEVSVDGERFMAVTPDSGGFAIPVFSDGAYTVSFQSAHHPDWTTTVEVVDGRNVKVDYTDDPVTRIIRLSGDLSFGNVAVDSIATRTLTIHNSGNSTLTVSGIGHPSGFSGAWSGTIMAGASHNVTVNFSPTAAQSYGGTITVNSDRTSGTNTRACSGTGVAAATRIIGLSGDMAFGNVTVGQNAQRTLTISNTGNSTLTVSGISYPSGFSGAWSGTIAAGASRNVTATFSPTAATSYGGNITVNSDRTSGTHTRTCSGTGVDTASDTTPPTITITSPTSAATWTSPNATMNIGGTASDNVGVTSVTIRNARDGIVRNATGTTTWQLSSLPLFEGQNQINVTAYDAAGNSGTDTITVTYGGPMVPSDSIVITDTRRPQFSWPAVPDATWYQIWLNRNGQTHLTPWIQGGTTWTPPSDLPAGNYAWWVKGWSQQFGHAAWSQRADFSIPARIPGPIAQLAPTGAQVSNNLSYRWTKDPNATWYRLSIGRTGVGTWHNRWYAMSGTGEGSVAINNHPHGNFTWWIQGWGPDGMGSWSGPVAFSTPDPSPTKPNLIAPIGQSVSPVTFQYASDRAQWYRVWVSRDGVTIIDQWTTSTAFNAGQMTAGNYAWWIGSWNDVTRTTVWSDRGDFWIP